MSTASDEFKLEEVDYCLGCETGLDSDDGHRDPDTGRYYNNCCVAAEIEYLEEQETKKRMESTTCTKCTAKCVAQGDDEDDEDEYYDDDYEDCRDGEIFRDIRDEPRNWRDWM
ncbi:hypothetical protein TrRE_jg6075 [Triparma retinervis]|uniref:Uncharacterized protein n=1 Tax=Triparma retinervis TaxID=2557542 RepID=A0A9W7E5N9_9STRA|nr:hypothetical protein TrRE_jg6075 [Triparma retinervis]